MDSKYLSSTETAKIIRTALKKHFPNVKFTVKQSRGGAINVDWIDGPTQRMVDAVVGQFHGSGFDGMIDMAYYFDHWLLKDGTVIIANCAGTVGSKGTVEPINNPQPEGAELVHFGNSFLFTHRHYSAKFMTQALARLVRIYGADYSLSQVKVSDFDNHAYLEHVSSEYWVERRAREEVARLMIAGAA